MGILETRKKVVCINDLKDIKNKIKQAKTNEISDIDINIILDFNDVKINTDLPVHTRFVKFIDEIKNPYIFKSGNITVKMEYSNSELNLEKALGRIIQNKM